MNLRIHRAQATRWARAVAIGVAAPGLATLLALAIRHAGATSAASLYVLAAAAAAAGGGIAGGLLCAGLGFFGLNYFFTSPLHTLKVRSVDDGVALAVFLVVASLVGTLVARSAAERARAEQREREARSLHRVTSAFLSSGPLERIVSNLASTLTDVLSLERCEIDAVVGGEPITVSHPRGAAAAGHDSERRFELQLATASAAYGTLVAFAAPHRWPPPAEDLKLARTVAAQTAAVLERAALDREIDRTRLRAETSSTRAALFSSVTHDLRTPLASIKASVTSLLDPGARLDDEQRIELLRTTIEETDRLNRLVGNILDLARVRAGALVPARIPVDVEDVIGSAVSRMRPLLADHPVRTMFRPDLPPVPLDTTQMDQVITNILENAARFSPPDGGITISASRWESSVEVRIGDVGPGIDEGDRERVFEEFYRQDRGRGRGGTGLGLAIARAIVNAHGGRIWAEGAPSGGTTIVLRLPIAPADLEAPT